MSRRDLANLSTALWNLTGGQADVAVDVDEINEAIGRGRGDMRTALNLQTLADQGFVLAPDEKRWALTPEGVASIDEDRRLSER